MGLAVLVGVSSPLADGESCGDDGNGGWLGSFCFS